MAHSLVHADRSVPALIVKIDRYPLHHGGLGAIRSLGRLGIPVYAITEHRWTPAALSRYLSGRFVWPTTGLEDPAWLVQGLVDIQRRIGRPTVLIPTDDEAAVLIAEHAAELGDRFLFPPVEATLPRRLASKRGLRELCVAHGIATPHAYFPTDPMELAQIAAEAQFPLVAKNLEAFERHRAPAVGGTTRVDDAAALYDLARAWGEKFSVILQDYLPIEDAEDWIVHVYCDASADCLVQFTGVKVRSWPPHAGVTTCAYSVDNTELADQTSRLMKSLGFQGVADLDWRYDRRDGRYYLLDFNPRVGAQFRLFQNEAGVDVVRAMHLDLTGRDVPAAPPVGGRRFIVENLDLPALQAYRRSPYSTPSVPGSASRTELGWLAKDDLRPFVAMLGWSSAPAARILGRVVHSHSRSTTG